MPRYSKRRVRELRPDIRTSRAAGLTFRQIAKVYRIGIATAYRAARDVPVYRPNRWHQARRPEVPPPAVSINWHRLLSTPSHP